MQRIHNKRLLMVVADGVDEEECRFMRGAFEREGGEVFVTAPTEEQSVLTTCGSKPGQPLFIDIPFEMVGEISFDAVVVPDGFASTEVLRAHPGVRALLQRCHDQGSAVFASGNAAELLYASGILSDVVLVREGAPLPAFVDEAIDVLRGATGRWPAVM